MIEKHYDKYIKSDSEEQLQRLLQGKTETSQIEGAENQVQVTENTEEVRWSGRVDLNHRLHGPEPCALPS